MMDLHVVQALAKEQDISSPENEEYHADVAIHGEEGRVDPRQIVGFTSPCS